MTFFPMAYRIISMIFKQFVCILDLVMNVSFAGCGFLGLYHVGVASCFKSYAPQLYLYKVN